MDVRVRDFAFGFTGGMAEARPSRAEAEAAVRTLIRWAGDDPRREGLADTPARVIRAYDEWFKGYGENAETILEKTFSETGGYDEMVLLRDIPFTSHCEHHMAPIIGRAHVAYVPRNALVGLSKLARLVDAHARRLQTQERLTAEIADALDDVVAPKGAAVMIEASHGCMTTRGVLKNGAHMVTTHMTGIFKTEMARRREFLAAVNGGSHRR